MYQVTCGDIGTNPERLEDKLEEIFDYAVTWGAILLLDEADVFLQDRDYENLQRNALVSSKSIPPTPRIKLLHPWFEYKVPRLPNLLSLPSYPRVL